MYFHANGSCYSDEEMRVVKLEEEMSALKSEMQRNKFLISGGPCPRKGQKTSWNEGNSILCCDICGKEYREEKRENVRVYMGPGGMYERMRIIGVHS